MLRLKFDSKSIKSSNLYTTADKESSKDFLRIRNPLDQMLEQKKDG
jgi:hypothetical protein